MHRAPVLLAEPWRVICEFVTHTKVTKSHQTAPWQPRRRFQARSYETHSVADRQFTTRLRQCQVNRGAPVIYTSQPQGLPAAMGKWSQ